MHKRLKWLLLPALLVTQLQLLLAQTSSDTSRCTDFSCCNTDMTPAGVMISHVHSKNEWMISYRYMSMFMSGLETGTTNINKDRVFNDYLMSPEKMNMQMHMLMGMYGITSRLTVMAMFNYQVNSMDMTMFSSGGHVHPGGHTNSSSTHHMNTMGLGDTKLHLLYGIVQRESCQLLASLGASVPTGTIHITGTADDAMYSNSHFPYGMQLGSGTVDILPSITYLHQKNDFAWSTSVSGTYRGGYNSLGYKLGNETTINSWIAYKWLSFISSSLRLQGTAAAAIDGHAPSLYVYNEPSANPLNYGGKNISAFFGSSFHFNRFLKNNRLGIECGTPVYQDLNGIQLKQHLTLNANWSFSF